MVRISFQIIKNTEIPSVVLSCESQKYIFNVPETFQRYYREHKFRLSNGSNFFFTRSSPEVSSGIIGLMLTLFVEQMALGTRFYGPKNLGNLFEYIRYSEVAGYKTFPYSYYDFDQGRVRTLGVKKLNHIEKLIKQAQENQCYIKDSVEQCRQFNVETEVPKCDQHNSVDSIKENSYFDDEYLSIHPILLKNPIEEESKEQFDSIIQYIIVTKVFQGGVNPDKIKEFNIPKLKLPQLFKTGVLEHEGKIINESDLRMDNTQQHSVVILDITSIEQLEVFLKNQKFQSIIQNKDIKLACFIHLGQPDIVLQEVYQNFVQAFTQADHLFCTLQGQELNELKEKHRKNVLRSIQVCDALSKYFPRNFPSIQNNKQIAILPQKENLHGYEHLYEYILFQYKYVPLMNVDYESICKEFKFKEEHQEILNKIFQQQQLIDYQDQRTLTFLGTGSMKPGKYRNVSAILIQLKDLNILLDCGEGTLKQIKDQNIELKGKALVIWISHAHSDHHLGMLNLIYTMLKQESQMNIHLLIPSIMLPFVYYYNQAFKCFSNLQISVIQQLEGLSNEQLISLVSEDFFSQRIRNEIFININSQNIQDLIFNIQDNKKNLLKLLQQSGIDEFNQVQVDHCPQAYGVAIKWNDGFKLTYSGDTRPSINFIQSSFQANIMIHEATFTDDLQENAIQNMHSTVREAVESAIKSESKNLVLTHFSQRYARSATKNKKPKLQNSNHKYLYSDQQYSYYLNNKTVYAVDHLKGYFDEYSQMVVMSHLIGSFLPDDE